MATAEYTTSLFFYAKWCGPCKRVKPVYESRIRPIYAMNGISCFEYDYDEPGTKELMEHINVQKIPKLVVIHTKEEIDDPHKIDMSSVLYCSVMDSHGIENNALEEVHPLKIEDSDEDF